MQLQDHLTALFPFAPTPEQQQLFEKLQEFMSAPATDRRAFLLKGYAGTGKTLVVQTLTKVLRKRRQKVVLLAPTGRAAKVLAKSAELEAFTIHRHLYKPVQHPFSGNIEMELRKNYAHKTLFVVDEASMLSAEGGSSGQGILLDLVNFIFSQPGNSLLLVGDPAQLPPVGETNSLALETDVLQYAYALKVFSFALRQVSRQRQQSGILANATALRECLENPATSLQLQTRGFDDTFLLPKHRLLEGLRYAFQKEGPEQTLLICATNNEALRMNKLIRQEVLALADAVAPGDLLMVARNNYQSVPRSSKISYLANGEFVEVVEVLGQEERFGFQFMRLRLRLPDEPAAPNFISLIITETLGSVQAALPEERSKALFEAAIRNYRYLPRSRQVKALRKDPHLNALQVKWAYALTCHKAQGGQWNTVLLQSQFWMQERQSSDRLRWLYTAITRARKELFVIAPALQYL